MRKFLALAFLLLLSPSAHAGLGDPETEAIMPRIKSDFYELIEGVACGDLSDRKLEIDESYVASVMLVSGGYPGSYGKGYEISGLGKTGGCAVFHAGTKESGGNIVTSGGRVLGVTSSGATPSSRTSAYAANCSSAAL